MHHRKKVGTIFIMNARNTIIHIIAIEGIIIRPAYMGLDGG